MESPTPTWSPMTHWPAFMVASSKFRSCFSEYLTPMSTPLCSPFVLAWRRGELRASRGGGQDPGARPRACGPGQAQALGCRLPPACHPVPRASRTQSPDGPSLPGIQAENSGGVLATPLSSPIAVYPTPQPPVRDTATISAPGSSLQPRGLSETSFGARLLTWDPPSPPTAGPCGLLFLKRQPSPPWSRSKGH